MERNKYLIIGLGNIGKSYEKTRHNIGFEVVKAFAKKNDFSFKESKKLKGYIARGQVDNDDFILLMPTTFMNESGIAARLVKDYYKISLDNILVIVDDVAIPLGEFRLKKDSTSGGHNGLKSIESHFKSAEYARLRIGVGDKKRASLVAHVLGDFSKSEKDKINEVIEKAIEFILSWHNQGLDKTMMKSNIRKKVTEKVIKTKKEKENLNET